MKNPIKMGRISQNVFSSCNLVIRYLCVNELLYGLCQSKIGFTQIRPIFYGLVRSFPIFGPLCANAGSTSQANLFGVEQNGAKQALISCTRRQYFYKALAPPFSALSCPTRGRSGRLRRAGCGLLAGKQHASEPAHVVQVAGYT